MVSVRLNKCDKNSLETVPRWHMTPLCKKKIIGRGRGGSDWNLGNMFEGYHQQWDTMKSLNGTYQKAIYKSSKVSL